ncbi:DUF3867 domain-containing protein [Clostridium cellulovorans]|uniref:DUF3867 domain-containing protein n=1 Tax=Clostridium cellulovorans (strain ATCC 35296 / DSM 3052 / OCM 3 / 743B) TaxID=573061 RepID=D9SSQ3_CLOC7|nr:DUF3867 domain-containing protein [Clostridium cellulovorans]ADL52565.1 hypothetical protein Clocel_2870 [Clostridium cellulovorans 743B]
MDDRIIDFNELKNRAKDKDVDKFESYIYDLYYSMAEGTLTMGEFTKNIFKYMEENNISQEKFYDIQKKIMERYGFDPNNLEAQMKNMGIDLGSVNGNVGADSYETLRKNISFQEKYKNRLKVKNVSEYYINNNINTINIILDGENVIITSVKKIDLINDNELNEFLTSYKKVLDGKSIKITMCEASHNYEY